ncbi:VWA domain-containing protein [Candidatus Uabimicrobium amorphum]|uniref:VWA domain-containing protein n=1 Tax=Uabimicrobium amorphum TaxID=2596890 RepID=A0A5S9ISI0_UABAM|nr:VWA domain-containing protein [Candidatus Uabimicrobium amorphum]BBM87299.1 VWA domain-containing protein [Candidatus Uabimicrobium amorphum]
MEFLQPTLFILLLPPLIIFLYKVFTKSREIGLFLWLFSAIFLVAAIAMPIVKFQKVQHHTIVCCIDTSRSISQKEMQEFLASPLHKEWVKAKKNKIYFLLFGDKLSIQKKLPQKITLAAHSVLEEALQGAIAIIAKNKMPGKVVVFSDGSQQQISPQTIAQYKTRKIPIFFQAPPARQSEFYFDKLTTAAQIYPHQRPQFTLSYRSNFAGNIRLKILANGDPYIMRTLPVDKGENVVNFSGSPLKSGHYFFQATVEANDRPENNYGSAATTVIKQPKVVIIGQQDNNYLSQVLEFYNIKTATAFAANEQYDAVIVINRNKMAEKNKRILQNYLEKGGSVLWMGQGSAGWLPGDYVPKQKEDPPKTQKPPQQKKKPLNDNKKPRKVTARKAAFVFIIDRSESMKGEKLQLAQRSALETISRLWVKDSIGVIAFDVEPDWVIPLGPIIDFAWAEKRLSQISTQGGGTIIRSALGMAFAKLRRTPAHIKHIILLTDGFGDVLSRGTIVNMVNEMNNSNITISTIGVGEVLDEPLLAAVAHEGGGEFYITEDHLNIRALVIKDVDRILKIRGPIPKEEVQPKQNKIKIPSIPDFKETPEPKPNDGNKKFYAVVKTAATQLLAKFKEFPVIDKYSDYTPRPGSKVELMTKESKAPILLQWSWKSGRVLQWTGEYKTWQDWKKYPQFYSTLVYHLLAKNVDAPQALLEVQQIKDNKGELLLTVTPPQNYQIDTPHKFLQISPVKWQASIVGKSTPQKVQVLVKNQEKIVARATTTFALPYHKEYRHLEINNKLLQSLATQTGGKSLTNSYNEIFTPSSVEDNYPLQNTFLWCSLFSIFLLIFFAMRKL